MSLAFIGCLFFPRFSWRTTKVYHRRLSEVVFKKGNNAFGRLAAYDIHTAFCICI
jgi:hypothetical protein